MIRRIVFIDEEKCDGCGECVPSCAEGAIRMAGGKARLVADALCDGLGACLGDCPRGAISVQEREAEAFDEAAVAAHLAATGTEPPPRGPGAGCPGSRPLDFAAARGSAGPRRLALVAPEPAAVARAPTPAGGSRLGQWPVQLHLVAPAAPFLRGADLLVAADCVPFAYARFHEDFLAGRRVLVGCPKLDDNRAYAEKLAEIFRRACPRSVAVVKMEVPCCGGIAWAVRQALAASGARIPCAEATVGIGGALVAPLAGT